MGNRSSLSYRPSAHASWPSSTELPRSCKPSSEPLLHSSTSSFHASLADAVEAGDVVVGGLVMSSSSIRLREDEGMR